MIDSYFIEKLLICKGERGDADGKSVVGLLLKHPQTKFVLHRTHYIIITACKSMYYKANRPEKEIISIN